MMLNEENKKLSRKLPRGRALYIALSVCVLAAGAAGFRGMMKDGASVRKAGENVSEHSTYVNIQKRIDAVTNPPAAESVQEAELTTVPVIITPTEAQEEPETAAAAQTEAQPEAEAVFGDDGGQTDDADDKTEGPEYRMPLSFDIGADYSMGVPVFSQTMKDYRTHNGVDFLGAEGEDVGSIGEGDVISVKKDPVWGNQVTVDHGDGIVSTVSGLADDDQLPQPGTHVYPGTVIGRVSEVPVEAAEASHVHLEVRYNGRTVDPLTLFGADANDAE